MAVFPETGAALSTSMGTRRSHVARFQRTVRLATQFTDVMLAAAALVIAYTLRYTAGIGGDVADENFVSIDVYLPLIAGLALGFLVVGRFSRLYDDVFRRPLLDEVWTIVLSVSFTMTLLFGAIFLWQGFAYSRGLFLIAWALTLAFLVASRVFGRVAIAVLRQRGVGIERVLVVGGGRLSQTVMHILTTEPGLPYRLTGFLDAGEVRDAGRFKCLGMHHDLAETARLHQIDLVIIALAREEHNLVELATEVCTSEGIEFKVVPDLFEMSLSLSPVDVTQLRGIPLIGPRQNSIQGWNLLLKRAMDIAVAGTVLLVVSPLWIAACIAIKLGSPGPVFFVQRRVGRDGQEFAARKFRSMYLDAEQRLAELEHHNEADGPLFKMRNDPRVTAVGRWLRRTSFDEMPQLLNVLAGDMSLVGPRPPIPAEVEKYEEHHLRRLSAAPGMTGLWQVSGRSDIPFEEMVLLDLYYIENWSLGLDLQIMLRTVPAVLTGRGAY